MKFVVVFRAIDEMGSDTDTPKPDIVELIGEAGLDMLDEMRESFPLYNDLPLSRVSINTLCPVNGHRHEIELTEEQARKSGRFCGKVTALVDVPPHGLSRYVYVKPSEGNQRVVTQDSFEIGPFTIREEKFRYDVRDVTFHFKINDEEIVDQWLLRGAPLKWNPNE